MAILWGALNEIINLSHNWTSIALTFLVARWVLTYLGYRFVHSLRWTEPVQSGLGRRTPKQLFSSSGVDPDTTPYFVFETGGLLAVSAYLALKGFLIFGTAACLLYGFLFLLIILGWLFAKVRIPLVLDRFSQTKKAPRGRNTFLINAVPFGVFGLGVQSMATAVPALAKEDIRLGCMLAALAALLTF